MLGLSPESGSYNRFKTGLKWESDFLLASFVKIRILTGFYFDLKFGAADAQKIGVISSTFFANIFRSGLTIFSS